MILNANSVMKISPIVPVVVVDNANEALDLAKVLYEGGISVMEITLRTKAGLEAIEKIANEFPSMIVGAGTVCDIQDYRNAVNSGSKFVFSPGITMSLIQESKNQTIPFIPGVSSASEIMLAKENDLTHCKLFPASLVGGVDILKAFGGPFPGINFCPTGGVNLNNMNDFLALDNVLCVGGSWVSSSKLVKEKKFKEITKIVQESLAVVLK
ncbi:multifunctional 2-keto-3-deoxygluconate 6-phosphate aldolase and 2-keto-4-hydroxyglutarate aldolase and oxaloacetate decarboxylase [Arcobacter acticola]|jgi:2-dehydro-3-deoxyphosphogluconate aldolase/(4S)-4-hydroxy-2-oxoglutarate aldolase|uniref:2-dehydro-3-deoxy-phosphogluconate aldolase n=1 Tax=Arcobacter acticola TaxID=1849015 RepID=A0A6M8EE05_9BACT|nr:bifunctional 4-hydroxy-2-oxoglutarate aldolase/2-dehydro-3-deoxy-phosphogluconate aldolase [Arcobacter acticola]MBP6712543.1 bifunctional 4-hydroxy-2-oxoglutarate aldolase/2-dehydro-3-deoxy-phosphogluconate aldolase [Aliarcobacter sp.]QKE27516.1 multifunctional 2-keto-3-deoxygluconate 6-phosphate aldolase and 2-keto-4-hydroxyglutarate aldolase and oxaloacetate decarboxylase [Arcobacter acticola]